MSSKRSIPQGPPVAGSEKFKDIVVGNKCDDTVVVKIYGNLWSCSRIIAESFLTEPGGALLVGTKLTNLSMPIDPSDAANKEYVDAASIGLQIKDPVDAATTGNITLSGVQTIDDYITMVGDRILVKDQTSGVENGIYVVSIGAWSRSSDLSAGDGASRTAVYVTNGTLNGGGTFVCTNTPPNDIVDTDALTFDLFIAGTAAGDGLSRVGNTLNVNVDNIGIEINGSNILQLKDGGVTNAKLANNSITINSGDGLTGGSIVSLGGSITLSVDSTVVRTTGYQEITGPKKFMDGIVLGSGSYGIQLQAPFMTSSYGLVFPSDDGLPDQFLQTDGTGILSWVSSTSGDVFGPASSTDNAIIRFDGTTGKLIQNSTVLISDAGEITGPTSIQSTSFTDGTATLSGGTLTGLLSPSNSTDATNKEYVDGLLAGIKWKPPARVASTVNLPLIGLVSVDGIIVNNGDRVLVKDQTNGVQNGIYVASGGVWTRASDLAVGSSASACIVWIEEGATQADTGYICTNDIGSDVVGTDWLYWLLFTGTGAILAGNGLTKVGNTLNVNVDNSTIEIVLNNLQVKALGITNTQIANNTITGAKIVNGTITNAKLANSSLTVTAGDGLTGGGTISLGGSGSLAVDSTVVRTSGAQDIAGPKTFTDSIILQDPDTPANLVTIQASTSTTGSYTLTLPIDDGTVGQVLTTDGSGVLSWSTGGGGSGDVVGPGSSTDNAIARFDGATGKIIQNSLVTISDTGVVTGITDLTVSGTTNTGLLNINSESIAGQRLYYGYDSTGNNTVTSSYQTMTYDTNSIIDTGYFNVGGVIVFVDAGTYEISYTSCFESLNNSGGPRATIKSRIELDTGGGFNPVGGSTSSCYIREDAGGLIGISSTKTILISISASDQIKVTYARSIGTTTCQTVPGESSLVIKRLRP